MSSASARPRRGQRAVEGDADPGAQPVEFVVGDARGVGDEVSAGDAVLERRQHRLEARQEALEEIRGRGLRAVQGDAVRLAPEHPLPAARRVVEQPGAARLLDADLRRRAELQRRIREPLGKRGRGRAARVEQRRERGFEAVEPLARNERRRAVERLAEDARQVLVAVGVTALPGAQRGDLGARAAVAEQLESYPKVASDQCAHALA